MIRIGLVDFDTSHVEAFTQRFNHLDVPESDWVQGAQVVAGCPGESQIMPERIPGYMEKLRGYGIEIVSHPEEMLGKIDAVMIESQQGSRHLQRSRPFLEAGLPTFVDKPFAESVEDADAMIGLAEQHRTPLLSCSALRYDPQIHAALAQQEQHGPIFAVDAWTPCNLHPGNPGLLHYGIHGVEMLYAMLGPGCREVRMTRTDAMDLAAASWPNGHVSTLRGIREGQQSFGFVAHYQKAHVPFLIQGAAFYRELLKAFVRMCTTREPVLDYPVMREIIAFIRAADSSAGRDGASERVSRP